MTLIVDSAGKGAALTGTEYDTNVDSMSGVNVVESGTTLTVTEAHQNDTIEFTNSGAVAVTLDPLSGVGNILDSIDTTDFKVTFLNTGAGTVTITPDGTNTINTGASTIVLETDEYVTIQNGNTNVIWNVVNGSLSTAGMTASTVTLAGTDGVVIDDGGSLIRECLVSDFKTYLSAGLNTKVLEIVSWNMDTAPTFNVAHGITQSKIRTVSAIIRDDSDTFYWPLTPGDNLTTEADGTIQTITATNITLKRKTSGAYDSTNYDTTGGYVRGWITIQYTD